MEVTSGALLDSEEIPVVTKEGYTFAGWYLDEEYTQKFDFETPITENVTLYAKFTEDEAVGENPKTGDDLYKNLVFLGIGSLGVVISLIPLIKKFAK